MAVTNPGTPNAIDNIYIGMVSSVVTEL